MSFATSGAGLPAAATAIAPPFDQLLAQPTAARFLSASVGAGQPSQAYLFTGPRGAGKTEAAHLLAKALLCPAGGADGCEQCQRVERQGHPDLAVLSPEGAGGYLAGQMQDLLRESALKPVRSPYKAYIITQADRMSVSFANAFLKVLEEPPASVVFILIARSAEALLPTIRSRCQVVPFGPVPEGQAAALLAAELKVPVERARLALACSSGSLADARGYLRSDSLPALRRELMGHLRGLLDYDALDVMEAARGLVIACKLPLDELRTSQERQLDEGRQTLSKTAQTSLEQRLKREMTAAERSQVRWLIGCLKSWLRDVLLTAAGAADGLEGIVNYDERAAIGAYAAHPAAGPAPPALIHSLMTCLQATAEAEAHLDYNVSVQSIFEYLLFTLREELGERR